MSCKHSCDFAGVVTLTVEIRFNSVDKLSSAELVKIRRHVAETDIWQNRMEVQFGELSDMQRATAGKSLNFLGVHKVNELSYSKRYTRGDEQWR